ncbi:MAG TPA: hypothetical protein VFY20_13490 [Gemmatimonadales bacterium]|nr:hypothetical protein [Gemmatimonadales bacterium]
MRFARPILLGAALVLVAGVAQAQEQLHFMRESVLRPAAGEDRVLVDKVREDLARVRVAEEAYYAANQTYASELSELKGVKLSSGTSVVILMSSPKGWKAEATHPSLAGAEVVHVMRMAAGEKCPMMDMGGMKGGMGQGGMAGKKAEAAPPAQHQH